MKKYLTCQYALLLALFMLSVPLRAQTDTEFWFAVPEVTEWSQIDRPINIVIATGTAAANVVISQPAVGATMPAISLAVPANTVHKENLTAHINILECKPAATVLNYGLRIVSDAPVSVYYEVIGQGSAPDPSNPEAFTLKGRSGLGTSFLVPSQNYVNNYSGVSPSARSSFDIVATEDNTSVTINPAAALQGGYAAGGSFMITLNRGQTWSATAAGQLAADQLPGSRVSSDKPIAVTVKGDLLNTSSIFVGPCSDLTGDQIVPVDMLGTEYIAMAGDLYAPGDQLFITALNNGTQIYRDGNATALATINAGQTFRMPVAATSGQMSTYVRTTGPAAVWQLTGIGCEMGATQLPQIACSGSSSVYYTRTLSFGLYVNLMVPAGGQTNFTINGVPLTTATWTAVPGTASQWFSTRLDLSTQVPQGTVLTVSNSSHLFHMSVLDGNAGNGTSYSYFSNYNRIVAKASASARDLCTGDSIRLFSVTVQNSTYQWTGPAGFNSSQQNPVIPGADSRYSGWYRLLVTSANARCGSSTDSVYVQVAALPVTNLGPDVSECRDSLRLASSPALTGVSHLWSNGSTAAAQVVYASGVYWLEITDNTTGCSNRDTIRVSLGMPLGVELGADTAVCAYDLPYVLSSPQPVGTRYLWSNGFSDTSMAVTRSGTYWLRVSRDGCTGADTIVLEVVRRPDVFLGNDRTICASVPEAIGTEIPGASYLWNTGSTTPYISVSQTGQYWLEVNLKGCTGRDTVSVVAMPDPAVDLGPDGYICKEEEIILDAGNEGSRYYWSTGGTGRTLAVRSAGFYHVTVVSPDNCTGSDSVLLTHLPDPVVRLGADTVVCEDTPLQLLPFALYADSLIWSDGSSAESLRVRYGGVYTVAAVNRCRKVSDTIDIRQIFCDIWVPNAFTPNGDGRNDVFRVLGNTYRAEGFSLSVYNRWGQRLFHTRDRNAGWDGYHNGVMSALGTYIYVVEYELEGKPVLLKGNFHLLR